MQSHEPQGTAASQPDSAQTQQRPAAEQQVGAERPNSSGAVAAVGPADSAEAAHAAQQSQQPAGFASTTSEGRHAVDAAQQPASDTPPDAGLSATPASDAIPTAAPPAQQQTTARAPQQRSHVIDIPAQPQQQLANPKRPALAPPSPPSPPHSGSLSDAELPPAAADNTQATLRLHSPSDCAPAADEAAAERGGHEQAKQADVKRDQQEGGQQDVVQEQQQQQQHEEDGPNGQQQGAPERTLEQAQPSLPLAGSNAAPATNRRNTPYICQVDGCGRNLAKEKEYYRRYRVCKSHAGAQEVVLGGEAKRYCQQCSVFHLLTDFDGDKRSCRARLSWHNNKRRKKVVTEGEALASASGSGTLAPRVTRGALAGKDKPADADGGVRSSGRVAARRVSSEAEDEAAGLQWGAVRGRRGGAAAPAIASSGQRPGLRPDTGAVPWGNGLGPAVEDAQQQLAAAAAAGAAAAAAAAPPMLLGSQLAQLQASSNLLAAAQAYAAGQRGSADPAALAAQLGLQQPPVGASWSALAALQSIDGSAAQLQHLARLQTSQAAAEAAAAREVDAAQAATQAAALAQLRDMPQQQRMQDPRAATSLINVVRAAFERQQQQQQQGAAGFHAEGKDASLASTSAFQPYRPTAVRAAPGADAAAAAAGYASMPLTIADPRAAHTANGSLPKDGSADWKARLLQRFHSAHAGTAEGA